MRPWELKWLNQAVWLVCKATVINIVGVMYGVLAGLYRHGPTELDQVVAALCDRGISVSQVRLILSALARAGLVTMKDAKLSLTAFGEPTAAVCDEWVSEGGAEDLSVPELLSVLQQTGSSSGGPHEAGAGGGSRA